MSDPSIETAYEFYRNTRPDERQYLTWRMSHETGYELKKITQSAVGHMFPPPFCKEDDAKCWEQLLGPPHLFGQPVEYDDSLPKWTIVPDIETPEERRIKDYAKQLPWWEDSSYSDRTHGIPDQCQATGTTDATRIAPSLVEENKGEAEWDLMASMVE